MPADLQPNIDELVGTMDISIPPNWDGPWWIITMDAKFCIDKASFIEAIAIAAHRGKIISIRAIPYPARPRLEVRSMIPSLCYSPDDCAGHTSCPKNPACSE